MKYAVILAGGVGSRFWPLSRSAQPKQFLNIFSGKNMLEDNISKVGSFIGQDNIYVATNKAYAGKAGSSLKKMNLNPKNLFLEPEGRNTFAAIAVLAFKIDSVDSDAVVVVLPCDNFIKDAGKFKKCIEAGMDAARQGYIVTLGITPTAPETGYGYIKISEKHKAKSVKRYHEVDRFIEKPSLLKAKEFIKDKRYFWNNGIFIFRPRVMLEEIKTLMPAAYATVILMNGKSGNLRLWRKLPNISIDYAIMQKTKKAALVPADYGWMDLGSWEALGKIMGKDKFGNTFKGPCIDVGSRNTFVWSDKPVATVGLDNIIIVETKDALLVCAKDKAQDIKKAVGILKKKKLKRLI